ncbi:MAG: VanZ family protein [Ignavibacteriales bacterium]|nr:VanZ family protein [Ignavibacteriales bacterium]
MPPRIILKYWLPVLLWMGLIFYMSTGMFSAQNTFDILQRFLRSVDPAITNSTVRLINNSLRKAGHVTEFFISGLLVFRAFKAGSTKPRILRWAMLSVVFIVLFAVSDEYHQSFVASRTASVLDVCIDAGGGLIAICVSMLRQYRKGR